MQAEGGVAVLEPAQLLQVRRRGPGAGRRVGVVGDRRPELVRDGQGVVDSLGQRGGTVLVVLKMGIYKLQWKKD